LPPSLRDALQRAESLWLEVPTTVRAQAWTERMVTMGIDTAGLLRAISASTGSPSNAGIDRWRSLADGGHAIDALTEVITVYLDPLGPISQSTSPRRVIALSSLTAEAIACEVERLAQLSDLGLD
jgi:hypothetical protein